MSQPLWILLSALSLCTATTAQSFRLDFQDGVGAWSTVLDGVMGGRSTGRVSQPEPGMLRFSGELSLENNGGFSQMRTAVREGALDGAEGLVLEGEMWALLSAAAYLAVGDLTSCSMELMARCRIIDDGDYRTDHSTVAITASALSHIADVVAEAGVEGSLVACLRDHAYWPILSSTCRAPGEL